MLLLLFLLEKMLIMYIFFETAAIFADVVGIDVDFLSLLLLKLLQCLLMLLFWLEKMLITYMYFC